MTKLEYEQALTDPRFRAAMQGFNNPANNINQLANHQLHEQETRNNELTRQISFQNDLANAKQQAMRLKSELADTKLQHQQELQTKQLEIANQQHQHELQTMKNKYEYDAKISQLNSALNNEKQQYADAQQRWKQKEEKHKAKHDLQIQQLQSQHDKEINDIKAITNDLVRKNDIENMEFNAAQEVAQATLNLQKAELKDHFQPITQRLEAMNNELKRKDDLLKTQYEELMKFKNSQADLIKENIKTYYEPMIHQMEAQSQTLSNINTTQQLLHNEQSKLNNAKLELSSAQIKAINEPLIRQLEQQKQQLEGLIKTNGDVNGLYQKIEDLKTNIEVLKQRATPEQIAEHNQEIRDVTLKMAPLQISKRLAEDTYKANLEYEQQLSKLVELGARALGEEFVAKEIGTDTLNNKLKAKQALIQQERAKIAAQTETIQRQIKMQEGLEADKIENAKEQAKLDVIMKHDSDYYKAIYAAGKERAKFEEENNKLRTIGEQISELKDNNEDLFIDTIHNYEDMLAQDKTGTLRRLAIEASGGNAPDPRNLPELLNKVKSMHERVEATLKDLDPKSELTESNEFNELVYKMDEAFRDRGIYTSDTRRHLSRDLDKTLKQVERDKVEKTELQSRIKQLEEQKRLSDDKAEEGKRYLQSMYYNITRPVMNQQDEEEDGTPISHELWGNLGGRNTINTTTRYVPINNKHALPMTEDNLQYMISDTGKTTQDFYDYIGATNIDAPMSSDNVPDFISEEYHPDIVNWSNVPQSAYPSPSKH